MRLSCYTEVGPWPSSGWRYCKRPGYVISDLTYGSNPQGWEKIEFNCCIGYRAIDFGPSALESSCPSGQYYCENVYRSGWNADALNGPEVGKFYMYYCPPGGSSGKTVYGTDIYNADSPVCKSAVHAGEITY